MEIIDKKDKENYCFIIAEAGVNHILNPSDLDRIGAKTSLEVAFKMVDIAKKAGADAIKFQSFQTKQLQFRGVKKPNYQNINVGDDNQVDYYDLIKSLETSQEDQKKISDYCEEKEIIFLSTPYDQNSADFLNDVINVPLFKLASIELNNHIFLKNIAKKGKPILLSTGLSELKDVRAVVEIAKREGFAENLVLLQCTSNYPTRTEEINLNVLKTYQKEFPEIRIGFSDHSPSYVASIGAAALGAIVIEKHFTLNNDFEGPDHSSSLNPDELKEWVAKVREISLSLGSFNKEITESEKENMSMRKYIVITPQKKGQIIEENMLKFMRTGNGIIPIEKNLKKIVGKELKTNIDKETPLKWEML